MNQADQFESLFGHLAIGQNPTPLHNRYLIMQWDFSLVKAQGEVKEIEAALHQHINDRITQFLMDYADYLTRPIAILPDNAIFSLESVWTAVTATPYKVYLLIDEYDSFSNEILMIRHQQRDYELLVYS